MTTTAQLTHALIATLPERPRLLFSEPPDETTLIRIATTIGRAQRWIIADPDPACIDNLIERLALWTVQQKLTTTWPARALLIHAPGGAWRIEGVSVDPTELMEPEFVDAVIIAGPHAGNAAWAAYQAPMDRPPLLACACPTGHVTWLPRLRADLKLNLKIRTARNPDAIIADLRGAGCTVASATSDLHIPAAALATIRAAVMAAADAAVAVSPEHHGIIEHWRTARLRQTLSSRLAVRIGNRDILAIPPVT